MIEQQTQDRRQELLRRKLAERGLAVAAPEPKRNPRQDGSLPVSAGQRRLWLAQQEDRQGSALNICLSYALTGALDVARLRAAVDAVVARHEILRTTYFFDDGGLDAEGELRQLPRADLAARFAEHDLSELPDQARANRLEVLARREFAQPFDLASEAPLRFGVFRLAPQEHVLILAFHHICLDFDSWPVFFGELNHLYNGGELPELARQFADVADLGTSAPAEQSLAYWRDQLASAPEPVELPGERLGGANPTARAGRREIRVPAELIGRARALGNAEGATPFMVLLAAFNAVMRRHMRSEEFFVSTPVGSAPSGREALIGYFGNIVLLRSQVELGSSFRTLVSLAREACLDAFSHQGVDFSDVVSLVRSSGSGSFGGLARLSFNARGGGDALALDGVSASRIGLRNSVTQLPLTCTVEWGADGGALLELEYLADVLDDETAEQLLRRYVNFLDSALGNPDLPVSRVELLGPDERAAELAASCGAEPPVGPELLHDLVQRQVESRPDEVAVAWDGGSMTYQELAARSSRLARWLIGQGVRPESIVAVRFAASPEFLVAILAVLKAGGAYLPVDPDYPQERVEHMFAEAKPVLVLDAQTLAAAEAACATLSAADVSDAERALPLRPTNAVYVIYTSGSTGAPKGVVVAHREIAAHTRSQIRNCEFGPQDRLLQVVSVSFDASLFEIFSVLGSGGRLVIPEPGRVLDIPYLGELMVRHEVAVVHMVPSLLAAVLALPESARWRTLRWVPIGGEPLPVELVSKAVATWGASVSNFYGPTEAVVCATGQTVVHPVGAGIVPIGRPLAGARAYLLDDALAQVPPGVVGELYLGGEHLARGYLANPALTADRFVADPFVPGARMYRTGDLVRRGAAGEIEFIGRMDEQVKIRGFRIELGEVTAAVSAHPDVGQCVTAVVELPAIGKALVSYVVPARQGAEVSSEQVRAQVATVLPEHMVPAAVVVVESIPLTSSGKLDRRALPLPELASNEYREPATPTERRLAELFSTLLGVPRVGADDSFFHLGGHSLLATRLVARIRAEFGANVDVRAPFDAPTPAALALVVDEACATSASVARPPLVRVEPRPEHVPLTYSQLMIWFQYRFEGPNTGYNMPMALHLDGAVDEELLRSALADLVVRHEALRTTFPDASGNPWQRVHPPAPVALSRVELGESELDGAIDEFSAHCFRLEEELPLRARLFVLAPDRRVLLLLVHHIVADHTSIQVMFRDLLAAYEARSAGEAPKWPSLAFRYSDYALWQRGCFDSAAEAPQDGPDGPDGSASYGQALLARGMDALAGIPEQTLVAADHHRPQVSELTSFRVRADIPHETWRDVAALAQEQGASRFMALHAVVVGMLSTLGAGSDIPLGVPVEGRGDMELEELLGLFANVGILRFDASGDPTWLDLLGRAKQSALAMHGYADLPFGALLKAMNPARTQSHNPLFQIMIHYFEPPGEPTVLDVVGGPVTAGYSPKFSGDNILNLDLSFHFEETREGGLEVLVVANTALYDQPTVELLAGQLAESFAVAARRPDSRVGEIEIAPALREKAISGQAAAAQPQGGPVLVDEAAAQALLGLLAELLELDEVDPEDGFFALGGDSIIAVQWSIRARDLGYSLQPQAVFQCSTLAEVVASAEVGGDEPAKQDVAHEPMSVSGLDADTLASLQAAWGEGPR